MSYADAVIGWVDASGIANVNSYYLTDHSVTTGDLNPGWATDMVVVRTADGRTIAAFTRDLNAPQAKVQPNLLATGVRRVTSGELGHWLLSS